MVIADSGKNRHWMLSHCVKICWGRDIDVVLKSLTADNVLIAKGRRVDFCWRNRADATQNEVMQGNVTCCGADWRAPPGRLPEEERGVAPVVSLLKMQNLRLIERPHPVNSSGRTFLRISVL